VPRSIWNGSLTVGLLTVPVKVRSATQDRAVRFREVHAPDGAPIEHRRFRPPTSWPRSSARSRTIRARESVSGRS